MTYEEQLNETIKQLELKLEEAFQCYDDTVSIYGNDDIASVETCYKMMDRTYKMMDRETRFKLGILRDKWKPLTQHIKRDSQVIECTLRLEFFSKMVKHKAYHRIFLPIIARGYSI